MTRDLRKWIFGDVKITLYKTKNNEYGVEYIKMVTPKEYAENNKDDFFVANCPEFYENDTLKTCEQTECWLYGSKKKAMRRVQKILRNKNVEVSK